MKSKKIAGSKCCNVDQKRGRDRKPPRQWGEGDELGSSATDDGKGNALKQFSSTTRKVNELIDRDPKLKLDPGLERRKRNKF